MMMQRLRYKARYYLEEGKWFVEIPDVGPPSGTLTYGDTREEARVMATDAVSQMLLAAVQMGQEPDPPSTGRLPGGDEWEWVYPDLRVEVPLLIRRMRQEADTSGISMAEAARRCGVSIGTYQRWEDPEECNATLSTLMRVGAAFGKKAAVIFQ